MFINLTLQKLMFKSEIGVITKDSLQKNLTLEYGKVFQV